MQMRDPARLWGDTARWVEARLGLYFTPHQWPALERGLQAAACRLDLAGAAACAERALGDGLDALQQQVLAECLTVGETYFFRDPGVFEQLATQVLAPLVARRRQGTRQLRLWSAGCASGEEAWSLAMLVAGLLPEWRDWNLSILATDINAAALQRARAGAYGRWSVRGSLPPAAQRFLRLGRDGRHHVDAELRRIVHFAPLNLAADGYPSAATRTTAMDLVLCRNVLIYFEPGRAQAVLARLGQCLVDDGWLVTGSVEVPRARVPGLRPVRLGEVHALRRGEPAGAAPAAPAPRAVSPQRTRPPMAPPEAQREGRAATRTPAAAEAPPAAAPGTPARALAEEARALANAGELAAAERLCRQGIAQDKLDADWTYLLATILSERGDREGASVALRRTLYLQPEHLLARFALGSLALRDGRVQAGRSHFTRVLARLAACPDGQVVQGSGGLTAGELQAMIRRASSAAPPT
jgi:chemotaxis protein methyltransferase CheR